MFSLGKKKININVIHWGKCIHSINYSGWKWQSENTDIFYLFLCQIVNKFLEGHRSMQIWIPCNIHSIICFLLQYIFCVTLQYLSFFKTPCIFSDLRIFVSFFLNPKYFHIQWLIESLSSTFGQLIHYIIWGFPTGPVTGRI